MPDALHARSLLNRPVEVLACVRQIFLSSLLWTSMSCPRSTFSRISPLATVAFHYQQAFASFGDMRRQLSKVCCGRGMAPVGYCPIPTASAALLISCEVRRPQRDYLEGLKYLLNFLTSNRAFEETRTWALVLLTHSSDASVALSRLWHQPRLPSSWMGSKDARWRRG